MFPDNRIRELRKRAGLTQAELGAKVGLHQTQIGNLENSGRNLNLEWARRIAKALNVTTAELLNDDDNPYRLSDEERELLHNYRAATAEQRAILARVAEPIAPFTGTPDDDDKLAPRRVA